MLILSGTENEIWKRKPGRKKEKFLCYSLKFPVTKIKVIAIYIYIYVYIPTIYTM